MGRTIGVLLVGSMLRVCGRDAGPVPAQPAMASATPGVVGARARLPAPRHGGRVQRVGDAYALETVAARTGGVALFWTDLQGRPVPPSRIALRPVRVEVDGRPRTVAVRAVQGAFVARVDVPASALVVVTVPYVEIDGVVYEEVVVPTIVVVAALPGIIVVSAPVVVVVHGKHRKFHKHRGYWWR
jgi:hypothetical protein